MKDYQKPKLTKYGELRSVTFSRENTGGLGQRMYSEESLYAAYKNAGYSDDDARKEAKSRTWHID